MLSLTTLNIDCSFDKRHKNEVNRDKQKMNKMQCYQLSWPNVSYANVTGRGKNDCLTRAHSFYNIEIVREQTKYAENLKQQCIFLAQLDDKNFGGARRKSKCKDFTSKGSIVNRSKEKRRNHSFNRKRLSLKSISKGNCILLLVCCC